MDGHDDIPGFGHPTQFPSPFGESSNIDSMPPPSWSSLPPLTPYSQIPTTSQPIEFGSHNLIPGSSHSPSMISQPSPVISFPPLSPSSLSFLGPPSALEANQEAALLPIPFSMLNSSAGGSRPPMAAHKRASSDTIISGLNSLLAQNKPPRYIYPKPMEMPVRVRSQEESVGEIGSHGEAAAMDVNVNKTTTVSEKTNSGVKRRAGKEIADSRRFRSVSMDGSLNGMWSIGEESPPIPVDWNDNAFQGVFTASEMNQIAVDDRLKALAPSDPNQVKKIIANREAGRRSKQRLARHISDMEDKVVTFKTNEAKLNAHIKHLERAKMEVECENNLLKSKVAILNGQARVRDDLIKELTADNRRLTGELSQHRSETDISNMESLDADILEQLLISNEEIIQGKLRGGGGVGIKD